MRMPPGPYMVYLLIDPRDMVPFYAGMTCRPGHRWGGHHYEGTARDRLRELRRLGLKCRVRLLAIGLSLEEAREREREAIARHRQTILNQDLRKPRSRNHRTGPAAILSTSREVGWMGGICTPSGRPETGAGTPMPAPWPPLASPRSWVGCGGGLPP